MHQFGINHVIYLVEAARWTIALSLVAFAGGTLLGFIFALARVQPASKLARGGALTVMRLFQATPLLMQLFIFYFGLSILGLELSAWTSASVALIFYTGAFLGEIWQGCIRAVPKGQSDAAKALALSYSQSMSRIILPQAVRIALAPTVGFLVQVIKSTSLASIVGFAELIRASQMVNNVTLRPLLVYSIVMLIYFVLCWPLSLWSRHLERRLAAKGRTGDAAVNPNLQAVAA
ncbi:amino acid ABC transporter permease [Shinella sp.]|uniref:amino acid ABC transporter permease n=1 Tax=Shinella sp. TaxID=1870904 RepID=UPI003F72105E